MVFDIFLPFRVPLKILKVFGIWQTKESSWTYLIYGIVMHLIFVDIYTLLQFGYLFTFETFEDFAVLMSVLPTYIAMLLKSLNFIMHIEEVKVLFDSVEAVLEKDPMTDKFKKRVENVDKVFRFFWASAVTTTVLGSLIPIVTRKLAYRMWFPYDYKNNALLFWLSAGLQSFESITYCGLDMVLNMFPAFFMAYIISMLEHLCDRLDGLKKRKTLNADGSINQEERKNNSKEFLNCVKYHLRIIEITRSVEKIFSTVLFLQGLMSTLILCTTSYALTIVILFKKIRSKHFTN